jgi:multidrug efflux pump
LTGFAYFIDRPIAAGVLSVLIVVMGFLGMSRLPISEYPEAAPPSILVRATYPGASPSTVSAVVAAPLEQAINGVEDSIYMYSQATPDGVMSLIVTFRLGTDVDEAQLKVQNRVAQALPKLPEEVRRLGVTTTKQAPDLVMVVHVVSPDRRYDDLYLRNYAALQVRDVLARIPGAGQVELFGSGDYAMRIWLDPERIAARGLSASEVLASLRGQNMQVAAGTIGEQPMESPVDLELQVNASGRLRDAAEFAAVIVKTGPQGETTRLADVGRVELGANSYRLRCLLDNEPAAALTIFQAPGANALELSSAVRSAMEELKRDFPESVDYAIVYDTTLFVRKAIRAVVATLLEAIALVVAVVVVFLRSARASVIPLVAVPVSLVGTFAAMLALGSSINALTLFGLVLSIGIVVDDAIVVVENVERHIASGLAPLAATRRAMGEVTGPILSITLVLTAVFVPTAFIAGLSGQFYRQFAITIASSTVISAFCALTLSPALAALLLRPHPAAAAGGSRAARLAWVGRAAERFGGWMEAAYLRAVAWLVGRRPLALAAYLLIVAFTVWMFLRMPTGFVPMQDKEYLVAIAQLAEGASLDRTDAVIRRMADVGLRHPDVRHAVSFVGLSVNGYSFSTSSGIVFFVLSPSDERESAGGALGVAGALNAEFGAIRDAFVLALPPPPVNGLGTIGGFRLFVEDRMDRGDDALFEATQDLIGRAAATGAVGGLFSTFTVNVPQLQVDVDRLKARSLGVPVESVFETLQLYLGSVYVNDFNQFGRTHQVIAQAEARFRDRPEDVGRLKAIGSEGRIVPLASLVSVRETHGSNRAMRYNGHPAAEINGAPAPGAGSGDAEALMSALAAEHLPHGFVAEWTDLAYQRIAAGNSLAYVYPLCVLLVFLVLAAHTESLRLPLAVIPVVPLCLLFAITGVWLAGSDNNVFTQIGFIVLIGLACKNAILIVEFARRRQADGLDAVAAVLEACRLRLRPILMTSVAFVAGAFPLVVAEGAGAEMRRAMGVAVFTGMIGVTLFGLFLTPVAYVLAMRTRRTALPGEPAVSRFAE